MKRLRRDQFPVRLTILFVVLLMSAGCATKIKVNMLQPAKYHKASMTKRVAVLPFSGPGGQEFAAEIEGVLANIYVDDKQYFTLVDRTAVNRTMGELQLSLSGAIDEKTAARVGQMVGAEGIYTGAVTLSKCADSYYKERRGECIKHQIKYDKKGNAYAGKCIRWRHYNVTCNKRAANFSCSPKLIEVNTGRIIYAHNLSGSAYSSGCEDTNPVRSKHELLRTAKEIAKMQLRKDVAPYLVSQEIKLMDSKDGITSKEAKSKFKLGIDYAGKQRMDRACELWEEARSLSPGSPSIFYNLGVCAESRGDPYKALTLYKKADKLIGKPNDDINIAIKRVSEAVKNQQKLEEELKEQ